MADYYTVLQRAVSALPENSGAGRRAIYDKARAALVRQLETIEPPLPAAEIAKQRLSLEEAVRRIEADVARSAAARPAPEPRREPPRPPITRPRPPAPEPARPEGPRADPSRPDQPRGEPPRAEITRVEAPRGEPPRPPARPDAPAVETPRPEAARAETTRPEVPRPEATRPDAPRADVPSAGPARPAPRIETPLRPPEPRVPPQRPDAPPRHPAPPLDAMRRDDIIDDAGGSAAAAGGAPSIEPPLRAETGRPVPPVSAAAGDAAPLPGDDEDGAGETGDRESRRAERQARKEKRRLARLGRSEDTDAADAAETDEAAAAADAEAPWLDLPPDTPPLRLPSKRRRNYTPLIAALVVLLVVVAGAATAYVFRDALLAEVDELLAEAPPEPRRTPPPAQSNGEQLAPKDEDRLPSANGQNGNGAADSRAVPTTRIVTPQTPGAPDAGPALAPPAGQAPDAAAPDGTAPAEPGAATEADPPEVPSAEAAGMTGPSRGILYEEGETAGAKGAALTGDVTWEMVRESIGGADPEPIVRATIAVPERQATTTILFRRNREDALPASHLIEVAFELPPEFPGGGISNLPGLIMKVTENARGDALIGASARVSDGLFWIALSSSETDEARNLELLKDRGWIDLPMLYDNGRRAILTVEKGSAGAAAIQQAIDAWASEPAN